MLRPEELVFAAMLDGWAAQQIARRLASRTVEDRRARLRDFAEHAEAPPWHWTPAMLDEWCTDGPLHQTLPMTHDQVMHEPLGGLVHQESTGDTRSREDLEREIAQLHQALTSRTVTGQATGIIGGRLQIPIDHAWSILRRASTDTNHKVRRIAEVVVSSHDNSRPAEDDAIAHDVEPILGFRLG